MSRPLAVVLAVALAVVLAAPASGHRRPGPRARAALRHAVERSHLVPGSIRGGGFHLLHPRISTVGPWARAVLIPRAHLDNADVIFRRRHGRWHLRVIGTGDVGCGHPRLPRAVRRDLGIVCP